MNHASSAHARALTQRTAELRLIGGEAMTGLGQGWSVDLDPRLDTHTGAYLNGPNGARLFLSVDFRDPSYLKVTGCYPSDYSHYSPASHSIRVARVRGPQVLAREITRRLMPGYLPELVTAQGFERQAAESYRVCVETAERICAALPDAIRPDLDPKQYHSPRISLPHNSPVPGHIKICHDGTSAMELRELPTAIVVQILELIEGLKVV